MLISYIVLHLSTSLFEGIEPNRLEIKSLMIVEEESLAMASLLIIKWESGESIWMVSS